MLEGPLVFVDIDTQRDFLEPSGALYVPGSQEILPNLERLTRFAQTHQIPILATACAHSADDPELAQFPPHCMAGTEGQQRVSETVSTGFDRPRTGRPADRRAPGHLTLNKREFDVFSRPDADDLVALQPVADRRSSFMVWRPIIASEPPSKACWPATVGSRSSPMRSGPSIRAKEAELMTDWARRGVLLSMTELICRPGS